MPQNWRLIVWNALSVEKHSRQRGQYEHFKKPYSSPNRANAQMCDDSSEIHVFAWQSKRGAVIVFKGIETDPILGAQFTDDQKKKRTNTCLKVKWLLTRRF